MKLPLNPPILMRVVLLVAVTLLATLGAMLLVTFRGPPPHARPLWVEEVATTVLTGHSPTIDWHMASTVSPKRPAVPEGMEIDQPLTRRLAERLGGAKHDVIVYVDPRGRWPGRGPDGKPGAGSRAGPGDPGFGPPRFMLFPRNPGMLHGTFLVVWRGDDGGWHSISGRQIGSLRWYAITLSMMLGIFALVLGPAYFVARRITKPIQRLAQGVASGSVDSADALPVEGPPEVMRLGHAFNAMRARLVGHVSQRTAMLIAIAHDLRTPMMRLALRLEQLPEDMRVKAQADVEEMQAMVRTLLDFVREDQQQEPLVKLDLLALVEALADDMADLKQAVVLSPSVRVIVRGDSGALRRCIGNLAENAVRYGGAARLALSREGGEAVLTVEDDGPGIPPDQIDRVFEPFYRTEQSRNRVTGGVGLGLTIARNIAERHGGRLALANRKEGGLRAELRLPVAD